MSISPSGMTPNREASVSYHNVHFTGLRCCFTAGSADSLTIKHEEDEWFERC